MRRNAAPGVALARAVSAPMSVRSGLRAGGVTIRAPWLGMAFRRENARDVPPADEHVGDNPSVDVFRAPHDDHGPPAQQRGQPLPRRVPTALPDLVRIDPSKTYRLPADKERIPVVHAKEPGHDHAPLAQRRRGARWVQTVETAEDEEPNEKREADDHAGRTREAPSACMSNRRYIARR